MEAEKSKTGQSLSRSSSKEEQFNNGEKDPLPSEPESTTDLSSLMTSPPVQTMSQPSDYDPNRIPLSIFSTKVTNPQEWSVASNELFSIHMGNNSFSRDYEFLFGKSDELSKPEDWNAASQAYLLAKSGELPRLEQKSTLSPVKEDETGMNSDKTGIEMKHDNEIQSKTAIDAKPASSAAAAAPPPEDKKPPAAASFPSPPRCSDESGNSVTSFAFPVLNENGKMSASSGSLKVIPEKSDQQQEQQQEQAAKETLGVDSGAKKSSIFSCWPHCC